MNPSRLYLVRHAEAEPTGESGDSARALTAGGKARFAALAQALATELHLSRILTSPLRRARETAEILAAATGAALEEEPALACGRCTGPQLFDMAEWAGWDVALVGHNPEIAEAVTLASVAPSPVRPGSVAAVDVQKGIATLVWIRDS